MIAEALLKCEDMKLTSFAGTRSRLEDAAQRKNILNRMEVFLEQYSRIKGRKIDK